MSERLKVRLISESDSGSDDDTVCRLGIPIRGRQRTLLNQIARRVQTTGSSCSLRCVLMFVSLVMNVLLITHVIVHEACKPGPSSLSCVPGPGGDGGSTTHQPAVDIQQVDQLPAQVPKCGESHPNLEAYRASAAGYGNIFEDLSLAELSSVYAYLSNQTELWVKPRQVRNASHIFSIELHIPNKTDVLKYLDGQGSKPIREARVVIERLNLAVPLVEEYVVGPLPGPSYHHPNPRRERSSVPYRFHPDYGIWAAHAQLLKEISPALHIIIEESFEASLVNCRQKCLVLLPQRTSSAYSNKTLVVFSAYYATDFTAINAVDLMFVMKESMKGSQKFQVYSVFYAGRLFPSLQELVMAYHSNSTPKARMLFPRPGSGETSKPGTMNIRGRRFPTFYQAGPRQFEPEGKRYLVTGQHVRYLDWSFNFRMSAATGPQVWDIRWAGERVAYEISLQEIAVLYAGANPRMFYAHLSDSAFGLGEKASGLVPGTDCPEHATFLSQNVFLTDINGPKFMPNAFCLFEHNTGIPLRRHRSSDNHNGRNYGGLVDRVLILRTIIVEYNYDYILDVIFHQNGAIELKTYATGYVMSHTYRKDESRFGFRIHGNISGSIHYHMMNFKIDLDVQGQANRYHTLDFITDERSWPWYRSGTEPFQQISYKSSLKRTEQEAVLRYNFSKPQYHIVYNEAKKNNYDNHRAYRITTSGFSKQILPDDSVVLKSRRWSKYQMLVTKRKDEEESSSSIYSMFDGENPQVDIDRYLQDNESIIDEDLVLWITTGHYHLPHTEDIPNTPTVGTESVISLLPFNYFRECPSVGSRDALRVDLRGQRVVVQDYGASRNSSCRPQTFSYLNLESSRSSLFP